MTLKTLTPGWQVTPRVTAFTTTRLGGASLPPYDGLNLGLHVGDDAALVMENRRRLQDYGEFPSTPHWLNQTHSADVQCIDASQNSASHADNDQKVFAPADVSEQIALSADGAWTDQPDTVLVVLTADCLPVVISDVDGTAIAVIHAGWRGLAAGILENALALFDGRSNLHAWLGPAIGPGAFEVGEDVRQTFAQRHSAHDSAFKQGVAPGKYWCDLYALARAELQRSGAITVTGGDYCTHRQSQWFHSHRRDGVRSGRMVTVVWVSSER